MLVLYTICYKTNNMKSTASIAAILIGALAALAQSGNWREHPAIRYSTAPVHDPVAALNQKLASGATNLSFDTTFGYLKSVLSSLKIPVESQLMVFSKTSLQSILISPDNPRAIFFNDSITVAWVRGSPLLELTAQDPQQGMIFYTLAQTPQSRPLFAPEVTGVCLGCHQTAENLDVPGGVSRSVFPGAAGAIVAGLVGSASDHRTPFEQRWGGWYVTGKRGPLYHRGNATVSGVRDGLSEETTTVARREPLPEKFSTSTYLTPHSDVIALAVFDHQMHMMNLITRVGWEARTESTTLTKLVKEFVDYLFFIDEAPLTAPLEGSSGYAETFAALGPFDGQGRSLRQFDLTNRLMRYPCSYMIYSEAFGALPQKAKQAIYERMREVLSGDEKDKRYDRLSVADRNAIKEILNHTLKID
jgi:hypothetical protein